MNRIVRTCIPFASFLILNVLLVVPALSQSKREFSSPPSRTESARQIALERYGLVNDIGKDSKLIARALYVKLKPGFEGVNAARSVQSLLNGAGFQVNAITTLAALDVPLDKSVLLNRAVLSADRLAIVQRAEAELGRIVEVCYANDMHPRVAAALIATLPGVEYAEATSIPQVLSAQDPNDPLIPEQDQLPFVKAFDAWKIWAGDTNTIIGIVDAGINMYHEDLASNIAPNPGESGKDSQGNDRATNGIDDDGNGVIDDWKGANLSFYLDDSPHGNTVGSEHGTQVAGYAAAATDNDIGIAGVANRCRFFPVKTASRNGGGLVEAYNGVLYCARRGFQVVNCSWGDPAYSRAEEEIMENVILAYNVTVVAAAGNDPIYQVLYPAGYRFVLGVGGVNTAGVLMKTWGEQIDVTSTAGYTTSGTSDYFWKDPSTSYTAPVVSGVVALVRSRWPELTGLQAAAHVRQSSDNVDALNLEKAKLMGLGKVNALKALETDPYSHPAVIIDSVWVTDENGNEKESFGFGERGKVWFRAVNVLGDLSNGTARIARYTDDSAAVNFDGSDLNIGSLKSGESWTTPQGVEFEVKGSGDAITRIRIEFSGDDYEDYGYEFLNIYRPYRIYETERSLVTLTESGRLGFDYHDYGSVGRGVTVDTRSLLYEGGLMIAELPSKVLDNVRNENTNGFNQDDEFTTVQGPLPENDYTLTLTDEDVIEGRRIGVEMNLRVITVDTVENGFALQVRVRNTRDTPIDSLRVALYLDWDFDGNSGSQHVQFFEETEDPVAFYAIASNPMGSRSAVGLMSPVEHPIYYAIEYNSDPLKLNDGFDKGEKWRTLSQGIGNSSQTTGDISYVIGSVLTNMEPNSEDTVTFLFGLTSVWRADQEVIDAIYKLAGKKVLAVDDGARQTAGEAVSVRPNPARNEIIVRMPDGIVPAVHGSMSLQSAEGREVRDLTGRLNAVRQGDEIRVDVSGIPSGLYYLRYDTGGHSGAVPVIIVK